MKAIYAGSFDPFTIGHLDIMEEAVQVFDEVHLVLSSNSEKKRRTDAKVMMNILIDLFKDWPRVKVVQHPGLIATYCREHEIDYLIRGLRNTSDYMYEENIARIYQETNPELRTLYFRSKNEAISSSMVWELLTYQQPVDKYLPYPTSLISPFL